MLNLPTPSPDPFTAITSAPTRLPCRLYQPGCVPFRTAWAWQQSLVAEHQQAPLTEDSLLLLQHPPVYTLGQGATVEHLKVARQEMAAEVIRIERGGEVTYHCPGQLVGYAIVNLRRHQPDLHWYLRQLEEVVIRAIAPFHLVGERIPSLTGVWVEGYKVAAIGIKVSRWITMHGFALNVCPDMAGFQAIVPCGIADRPVGSLAQWIPQVSLTSVQKSLEEAFAEVFEVELIPRPLSDLQP